MYMNSDRHPNCSSICCWVTGCKHTRDFLIVTGIGFLLNRSTLTTFLPHTSQDFYTRLLRTARITNTTLDHYSGSKASALGWWCMASHTHDTGTWQKQILKGGRISAWFKERLQSLQISTTNGQACDEGCEYRKISNTANCNA